MAQAYSIRMHPFSIFPSFQLTESSPSPRSPPLLEHQRANPDKNRLCVNRRTQEWSGHINNKSVSLPLVLLCHGISESVYRVPPLLPFPAGRLRGSAAYRSQLRVSTRLLPFVSLVCYTWQGCSNICLLQERSDIGPEHSFIHALHRGTDGHCGCGDHSHQRRAKSAQINLKMFLDICYVRYIQMSCAVVLPHIIVVFVPYVYHPGGFESNNVVTCQSSH